MSDSYGGTANPIGAEEARLALAPGHPYALGVQDGYPRLRAAGAVMGVIGVFSYLGAAIQEQVSGILIDRNMIMAGDDRIYDFGPVIWFWIGSSVVSMLLAASLWRTKLRD